jgi:hypothetical protein
MSQESENNKKYKKLNSQMAFVKKSKQQSSLAKEAKHRSIQASKEMPRTTKNTVTETKQSPEMSQPNVETAAPLAKARKPRAPMTEEQKTANAEKRKAAKQSAAPEPTASKADNEPTADNEQKADEGKKVRKPREKMTDDQKTAMAEKRKATLAAKKTDAPVEPKEKKVKAEKVKKVKEPKASDVTDAEGQPADAQPADAQKKTRKPREPLSDDAKAAMAEKRKATLAAKKVQPDAPVTPAPAEKATTPGAPKKSSKRSAPASGASPVKQLNLEAAAEEKPKAPRGKKAKAV